MLLVDLFNVNFKIVMKAISKEVAFLIVKNF
nr:MAG TPA: hypothetical protein [Caudoviricetes sp.]